jgi:hypothetical protein
MFNWFCRRRRAVSLIIVRVSKIMQINFQAGGKLTETITPIFKDKDGAVTTLHGAVTYTSSDESIATVVEGADGVTAVVTGTGKVGTATISATDAQDNASDFATVTTIAAEPGEAVSMALEEVVQPVAFVEPAAPVDPAPAAAAEPAPVDPAPAVAYKN